MTAHIYKNDYSATIKKVCIFCTYLHTKNLPEYVIHYINSLREIGYETIIVSHSDILENDLKKLSKVCCGIILKENVGYDFFAWKYGMKLLGDVSSIDALLLANDSIIGPFNDLCGIFSKMIERYDFWGLTESYEHQYHIQSYFLHANNKVLKNENWINFWNDLILYEDKLDIVKNYEIELTQTLKKSRNIEIGAWVSHDELISKYPPRQYVGYPGTDYWHGIANPTIKHWKELVTDFDFPFIKKNLFFEKEHYDFVYNNNIYRYKVFAVNWKNIISLKYGSSSVSLIEDFLSNIYDSRNISFRQASYKILFVYEEINKSAQIDYLARLLKFYNTRNIETELILNSVPGLQNIFDRRVCDITKVTIIKEISKKELEVLKHRISQEYVGMIIIGDVSSVRLARSFSYTNAPHLLITDDLQSVSNISPGEYNLKLHSPIIATNLLTIVQKKGISIGIDPINIPETRTKPERKDTVSLLTFIGLSDFEKQKDQIAAFIKTLKNKGMNLYVRLLFNADEYIQLKALLKSSPATLSVFQKELDCSFSQYENLEQDFNEETGEIIISYFDEKYLPEEYLQCYLHKKLLLFQAGNDLHKIICGKPEYTLYEFFKVELMAETVFALANNKQLYTEILTEQYSAFKKYIQQSKISDYEELLFRKMIDFTELKIKEPPIAVIFHFHFYSFDEISFINYKKRLRAFFRSNITYIFSITEDSYAINEHAESLKKAFPHCIVKIVPNKGRDIGAKFLLFDYLIKLKIPFEYVVVLHDKKSLHLPFKEAKLWIDSLLRIIDPINYERILKTFGKNPRVGIIGSSERITDCIIKWSDENGIRKPVFEWNNDLLHEMILKYNINIEDYNFVGGTMFWIKAELLKKLDNEYGFIEQYKTLEKGNVMDNNGSTITHSWERLLCWLATNMGYTISKLN